MNSQIQRISAEQTWELRQQVMYPNKPISHVQIAGEAAAYHYGLFDNDQLIAVISLFVDGREGQFRKFATATHIQGKGYGTQLLLYLISEARQLGLSRLWCDARTSAVGFYERLGLRPEGKTFYKGEIAYIKMHLSLD